MINEYIRTPNDTYMVQPKKITCKDHTVSGEEFTLIYNDEMSLYKTTPVPEEKNLGKYYDSDAYISHTDSKKGFIDFIYQVVKNYTLSNKVTYINTTNPSKGKLLDIGAGTGDFLLKAKKKGWEVYGVEPNEIARKKANEKGLELKKDVAFENQKFDVISMWHVLEHVPNLEQQIETLKNLLAENGTLFVAVPNFNSFDAKHYKQYWAAYDVPRHLWHFSREAIKKLFHPKKLFVVKILPMKFDSYYVSLLSEKYKTGKSNFIKALYNGFKSNLNANNTGEYSSLIYIIKKGGKLK